MPLQEQKHVSNLRIQTCGYDHEDEIYEDVSEFLKEKRCSNMDSLFHLTLKNFPNLFSLLVHVCSDLKLQRDMKRIRFDGKYYVKLVKMKLEFSKIEHFLLDIRFPILKTLSLRRAGKGQIKQNLKINFEKIPKLETIKLRNWTSDINFQLRNQLESILLKDYISLIVGGTISSLYKLKSLKMENSAITRIKDLKILEFLEISFQANFVYQNWRYSIQNLNNLKELVLRQIEKRPISLVFIIKNLERLEKVAFNGLSFPMELRRIPNLRKLVLDDCSRKIDFPCPKIDTPLLQVLEIDLFYPDCYRHIITRKKLSSWKDSLRRLTIGEISDSEEIDDLPYNSFSFIDFKRLEVINISESSGATVKKIIDCPFLEEISARFCSPSLEILNLPSVKNIWAFSKDMNVVKRIFRSIQKLGIVLELLDISVGLHDKTKLFLDYYQVKSIKKLELEGIRTVNIDGCGLEEIFLEEVVIYAKKIEIKNINSLKSCKLNSMKKKLVIENCSNLEEIEISTRGLNLSVSLGNLPSLRKLTIESDLDSKVGCLKLSNVGSEIPVEILYTSEEMFFE